MNYFKPEKYYYIIPITRIDNGIILEGKQCERRSLYNYVNECFPILRQLDIERANICYGTDVKRLGPVSATLYDEQVKLIRNSLMYLDLPKHILAVGNNDEAIEPVTGVKLHCESGLLHTYRVSDCDLEHFYMNDYERKINNFFDPDFTILLNAQKPREEFVEEVNKQYTKQVVQKRKTAGRKAKKGND